MTWTKEKAQDERLTANAAVAQAFIDEAVVKNSKLEEELAEIEVGETQHPDAATHEALGLAPTVHSHAHNHDGSYSASGHTHVHNHDANYSATGHNHDAAYSASGHGHVHNHDGVYEPTHAHPYSSDVHNHDLVYSATGHTHAGGSHPDLATHDTLGLATQTELDDGLATKAASGHNHDAAYSATAHNHDAAYVNEADHTKAAHDALNIDADTLDGNDATAFATSGHTHANDHARQHSITSASDHTFPGGTTFLRADGTFASPPGGSEAFPVGSVFISTVSTNPGTLLGYGTWVAYAAGRVLVGIDAGQTEFDAAGETGGAKTHTLTEAEMPSHVHDQNAPTSASGGSNRFATDTNANGSTASGTTAATGGGGAHNNLQPYIVVYIWHRTA